MYTGIRQRKARGNERGKSKRRGRSAYFSLRMCVSVPPLGLERTGDLDKEERRVGRRGYDLGAGLAGCGDGIDERPREEGSLACAFPLLSSARPKSRGS
jgi:hypothetical protein